MIVSELKAAVTEPEAAVAIVHARGERESILLIRRSERKDDPWSGHWSFPGGRRDADDPDLLHTALRELEEECGITLGRGEMSAALRPALARRAAGPFVLVAPFVLDVGGELPAVVDGEEAVEAVWIPLSVWRDPGKHRLRAVPGLPGNMLFPAVDLNGVPVWGFTYRLTMEWLGLPAGAGSLEEAGFQVASRVLDFLVSHGVRVKQDWQDSHMQDPVGGQKARLARVEGMIPVKQLVAHFSKPGELFPNLNIIEIRPDGVRVVGMGFEEYLILN